MDSRLRGNDICLLVATFYATGGLLLAKRMTAVTPRADPVIPAQAGIHRLITTTFGLRIGVALWL